MADLVGWRIVGRTALLTIDHQPLNALSTTVREALKQGVDRAEADPAVAAVAIVAEGRIFSSGLDLAELEAGPSAVASLRDLCDRIEMCGKPVIAGMHGSALGGALELALAAHWRLAAAGTDVGFPGIRLGLIPGAGGTWRLPRLTGAKAALDLLLSGERIPAVEAARLGLLDGVIQGDITSACVGLAENLLERGIGPRPTAERADGLSDPRRFMAEVAARRTVERRGGPVAEKRIIDCVEAALLLPANALRDYEADAVVECLEDPMSRALRHLSIAERRAARQPVGAAPPVQVDCLGLAGSGRRSAVLAAAALDAGLAVVLAAPTGVALGQRISAIEELYSRRAEAGQLSEDVAAERLARLEGVVGGDAFAVCDAALICAAAPDEAEALARELGPRLGPSALLAIDCPALDTDRTAAAAGLTDRTFGFHPAAGTTVRRLVEIAPCRGLSTEALGGAFRLARRLGRMPVVVAAGSDTLVARLSDAMRRSAETLLLEGATPAQVDRALRTSGFAEGPFEATDREGLVAAAARDGAARAASGDPSRPLSLTEILCREGRRGITGERRGFYRYAFVGAAPEPDEDVVERLRREREARGLVPRSVSDTEIVRRSLAALVAEGARMVEDGAVPRTSDIDVVAVDGLGLSRRIGGPMHWADAQGLLLLRDDMRIWSEIDPWTWASVPLIEELIKSGGRFRDVDRTET